MPTWDDAQMQWVAVLKDRGIDFRSTDDTVLGAALVYCEAHCNVHRAGQCTVPLYDKRPLDATDYDTARDEVRAKGMWIYGDPRPCVHCGVMVTGTQSPYRDTDGHDVCSPGKKRSPFHTPHRQF
jgi:hypothetical protein